MTVPEVGSVMKIRKPSVLVACIIASTLIVRSFAQAQQLQNSAAANFEIQTLWDQAQQSCCERFHDQARLTVESPPYGGLITELAVSAEK